MRATRSLAVATLLVASGCGIAEGWYIVKGRVSAESAGAPVPLPGATVLTRNGAHGRPQDPRTTGADGGYRTRYGFGCMVPFCFGVPGDPWVEFAAPGFQSKVVRLRGGEADPLVTRSACVPRPATECFGLDVVLAPDPSAGSTPPVPGG